MTIEEFIYDVRTILRQNDSNVSGFSDLYILRKGLNYRVNFILEEYAYTRTINPEWIMRLGNKALTPVGSADNPAIPDGTVKVGKITIPQTIPVGVDAGLQMIMNTQRQKQIYRTTWPMLMHMITTKDDRLKMFSYYATIGLDLYVYKYTDEIDISLIPDNPLECVQFSTAYIPVSDMINGQEYYVISGHIKQTLEGVETIFRKNETFTFNESAVYVSNGKYRDENQIKEITATTIFPTDSGMAQRIILEILMKDFAVELRNIPDIYVDSADQRKTVTRDPRSVR